MESGKGPFSLLSCSVARGETGVATNVLIQLDFGRNVVNISVLEHNAGCFHLANEAGDSVPVRLLFPDDQLQRAVKRTVFLQPVEPLAAESRYVLAVDNALLAKNGTRIDQAYQISFTTGGEQAAQENDVVHLFVLSQEAGPIPFRVRRQLVHAGVADLPNVICHDSDAYIISSATFPSYFLKDEEEVVRTQAALDLAVFGKIAAALGIQRRYVGEEPTSRTTCLYNEVMARAMPEMGMECHIVPRVEADGRIISASTVRQAIHDGQLESVRDMLPESTYRYFAGPEGAQVVAALKQAHDLIHH